MRVLVTGGAGFIGSHVADAYLRRGDENAGSGTRVEVQHAAARPGELRHSSLDAGQLRSHGWEPASTLEEGLATTYRWIEAGLRASR